MSCAETVRDVVHSSGVWAGSWMRNGATCMFSRLTTAKQPITHSDCEAESCSRSLCCLKYSHYINSELNHLPNTNQTFVHECDLFILMIKVLELINMWQVIFTHINTIYFWKLFIHYLENIDKPVILFFISVRHIFQAPDILLWSTQGHTSATLAYLILSATKQTDDW